MTYGLASPWQNRPSLVACWEHSATFVDTQGIPIETMFASMDGLNIGQINVCIPRACRMTRFCLIYAYDSMTIPGTQFDLVFQRSQACGADGSFLLTEIVSIPAKTPGFITNCFCSDLQEMIFDECDVWRCYFDATAALGIVIPLMRILFHFELR